VLVDYLCSGTLLRRMMICGKPNCQCAKDPSARHGPYYQGAHEGHKLAHRMVTAEWERETERLIDAETAE